MRGNFDNSGKLVRFILRRERIVSAIWVVALVLFSMAVAPAIEGMFSEPEARMQFAESFDNPVMVAMMGPVYGIDNYTTGVMYAGTMLLWAIIAVAVMNIFLVVRHTRADEERGRVEVIRSLPSGRLSILNAAMICAGIVNAALAVLLGLALAAMGIEGMDLASSMLYGLTVGASGFVFAAVAALFSQLSSNKGGATGLSFLALAVFYLLRAAGDVQGSEALARISPLGLAQRSQAFVGNYVWPVLVLLAETAVVAAAAYALNSVRDMGQGFISARPGRGAAAKGLLSPFGLSARLLRNTLVIWIIVMFVLAASYGSVIADIPEFVGESPEYLQVIGIPEAVANTMAQSEKAQVIIDYFGVFVVTMMTLVCLVPVIIASLKLRSEEREGRAEQIFALAVPRLRYLSGFVILAFAASVLIPLAAALGLYSATAVAESSPFAFGGLIGAFMVYLPAIWVMIGAAVFLVGLFPRAAGAVWGFYGFVFIVALLGGMPGLLPEWLQNISPMKHIPKLPLEEMTFAPLIVLAAIAFALCAVGFVSFGKRDSAAG